MKEHSVEHTSTSSDFSEIDRLRAVVGTGSLASLLAWRTAERPGHGFLFVEDEPVWTFGELASAAASLARRLAHAGVAAGARVLARVGNDERFLPVLVAGWLRGAAVIPMHPAAPVSEVARVIGSMGVGAVVCDPQDDLAEDQIGAAVLALGRLVHDRRSGPVPALPMPPVVRGAEPALILLTSGSTGAPKGVVLTHDNAWANLRATASAFRSDTSASPLPETPKPPNLIANPLSHTAGIVRLLFALYVGRDVVLLRKFDGALAKRLVDQHGIDNLTLNPAMLRMLLDQVAPGEKLGAVRYVSSGTAPLTPALREQFEARFGVPVLQAYGQTEAFGGIAIENVRDVLAGRRRPGSVGKPLPGVELRLADHRGDDVPAGEPGEIWVRSASAMAGYFSGGEANPLDADGWLRTGDVGRLDEDGYLFITGRIKNIIICGGFNITPEEVEAALEDDGRVTEAVVVSWPDERLGEIPVAVVEGDGSPAELLAAVAPRLAAYKRPRRLFRVDALPRVPNGKVDRAAVWRLVAELTAAAV
jgi:long-chain acyl-CoA synthetase